MAINVDALELASQNNVFDSPISGLEIASKATHQYMGVAILCQVEKPVWCEINGTEWILGEQHIWHYLSVKIIYGVMNIFKQFHLSRFGQPAAPRHGAGGKDRRTLHVTLGKHI